MQIHELELIVSEDHLDARNHVNNVQYVQWVQDIAEAHWTLKAPKDIQVNFYWVMLSHFIQYKAEAVLGDVLKLKTFVTKSEGVRSTRVVELYNATTNKLLSTSETIWCFISNENHRPTRIPEHVQMLFG